MATKSTKKASKKAATPKKTAKSLAAKKSVKKKGEQPAKVLAVANGESNVSSNTTTVEKLTFDSLLDKEHSITPAEAERIAESRRTHEDERPPNSNLTVPELVARAWDEVRDTDPPLSGCVQSHCDKYLHHAQVVLKGSPPLGGSTKLAQFEQAVNRLMKENK